MNDEQEIKQPKSQQEKAAAKQERFRQRVRDEIEAERSARFPWTGFVGAVVAVGVVVAGLVVRSNLDDRIDALGREVGYAGSSHCDLGLPYQWCTDWPASGLWAEVEALREQVTVLEDEKWVRDQEDALDAALAKAHGAGLTRIDCTTGGLEGGSWAGSPVLVYRDGQWWTDSSALADETASSLADDGGVTAEDLVRDRLIDHDSDEPTWGLSTDGEDDSQRRTAEPCVRAAEQAVAVVAQVHGGQTQ